jgi:AcrR family transcriptional regulator
MDGTEDRRVRRTKRILRQALVELIQEKEFQKITVTDVVKQADINRGTFYVYYRDVYDLLEKVENEMIEEFRLIHIENLPSSEHKYSHRLIPNLHPLLEQAVGFLEKNRTMVCALLRASTSDGFKGKMMHVIEDFRLSVLHDTQEKEIFLTQFLAAGAVGVMSKWIMEENRTSKEILIDMLDELLRKTLPLSGES